MAAVALIGPLTFQWVSTSIVFLRSMSLLRDAISILVYGPYGWLQTVSFYIFGVSVLTTAAIMQFKLTVKLNLGAILLALMGFAFILIATCPTQPPGGAVTPIADVHRWATTFVVMVFPLACFFIAPSFKAWGYRRLYRYTIAAGIFQLFFVFIGGYVAVLQFGLVGMYERVLLLNGQAWLIVVCVKLIFTEARLVLSPHAQHALLTHLVARATGKPATAPRKPSLLKWSALALLGLGTGYAALKTYATVRARARRDD